jgi:anti-sigma factor RsiW
MSPVHSAITEADLHAYIDGQLAPERQADMQAYLAQHPDAAQRFAAYRSQTQGLRALFAPVLLETLPPRLLQAALPRTSRTPWYGQSWLGQRLVASVAIAVVSAASAWFVRGSADQTLASVPMAVEPVLTGFAQRAAVAHVVYSPEVRHPVEVSADQEPHLVAWLSKRLGAAISVPSLQPIGYALLGGRLLPGDSGPVAQFMYADASGQRLTLYVTHEAPKLANQPETAFHFGQDGKTNVFYWVDKSFGYALSGSVAKPELARVAHEVHRQLAPG